MPAAVWMYVIFSFSDQVGETSAGLSLKVTEKVVEILMKLRIGPDDYYYMIEVLHPLVRKGAHMAEYAILFLLSAALPVVPCNNAGDQKHGDIDHILILLRVRG